MALRDRLQKYKLGTGLQQTSAEELQSLTNKAERPIAPSTPVETSVLGGTADQAKMAGTPNQKTSALRVAIQQSKNLGDVQRTQQNRQQLTGQETAATQKAKSAENLSNLNNRVQALTGQMLQQAQSTATAQMQVDPSKLSTIPQESQAEAQQLLQKLGTNQATNQDILRLNQLMGKTNIQDQLTPDQIKANFMTAGQAAGQALAQQTADTINVSQINPTELGFQDMNELANVLGVDPAELGNLSLKDLQDQAQKLFQDEFDKVNTLEARANDLNLGPAERAEARKQLKDAGATGIRQVESGIDKLADQVANADTVKFAGSDLKVEEVLSDEYLSGLAARYVDADETDPLKQELKQTEPELAKWLDDNAEVLKQATAELDQDVKAFSELQYQNQKLKSSPDLPDLTDGMMKSIFPDWGEMRAEAYNPDQTPALKYMQDTSIPQVQRANVRNAFEQINSLSPQLTGQLARLTPQQLDALGATSGGANPKWQSVTSYLKDVSNVNAVSAAQPDTIAAFILGPGKTFNDLMSLAESTQARARSGLFGNSPIDDELTGILQTGSPDQIATYLKQKFAQPQDIASLVNNTPTSASQTGQLANTYAQQTSEVFDLTQKYFSKDSTLDDADIADLAKTSYQGLEKVYNSPLINKLSPAAKRTVQGAYEKYASPDLSRQLLNSKQLPLPTIYNLIKKPVGKLSMEETLKMNSSLAQIKSQLAATNAKANPLQYKFLSDTVKDLESNIKSHYDDWKKKALETIVAGRSPDAQKALNELLGSNYPGSDIARKELAKVFGVDDEAVLDKIAKRMGKKNLSFLESANSLDLGGNAAREIGKLTEKIMKGAGVKRSPESDIKNVASKIGTAAKKVKI